MVVMTLVVTKTRCESGAAPNQRVSGDTLISGSTYFSHAVNCAAKARRRADAIMTESFRTGFFVLWCEGMKKN